MGCTEFYSFLDKLEHHNSKQWMDNHREDYHMAKKWFLQWLKDVDIALQQQFKGYHKTNAKSAINRINNNRKYHPEKPTYKNHFSANLDKASNNAEFVIHLGTDISFIAGGFYRPTSEMLKKIRKRIDTEGAIFKAILNKPSFKNKFGKLHDIHPLKTVPRGYSMTHPYIDLLRHNSYIVMKTFTREEVCSTDFISQVVTIYDEMKEFRAFLKDAVIND